MDITLAMVKETVQPISVLSLVGLCLYLVKMSNGKLKGKVSRHECHSAQEGVKNRIDELDKNINRRFDDLKDFLIRNGNDKT